MDSLAWLPFFLQTSDALFPTGAYAHSLGFEESVRLEGIKNEQSLGEFLRLQVLPALREHELPYLRFAYEAPGLDELCSLDREIGAWKLARETREASLQLGGRRLKALRNISNDPALIAFEDAIREGRADGHHLVICALQARTEGIPLETALAAYAYQALAAICAAALKLIRIGQDGIHRALRQTSTEIPAAIEASVAVPRRTAGWFNPLLEIASMRHERAFERLFIS